MKILVALDGSRYSDEILSELSRRPWFAHTQLRLVSAVEPTDHWESDQQHISQVECILKDRVAALRAKLPPEVEVVGEVIEGVAAKAINKIALEWNCDQIIIGSHGDTGVRRLGMGSVAAAIVNDAPCSVEVLKLFNKSESDSAQKKLHAAKHD